MGREKHWPVPYSQAIQPQDLERIRVIGIKGEVKWKLFTPKFYINLAVGPECHGHHIKDAIGVNIGYRGHEEGFVINSYASGHWGTEVRAKGPDLKKKDEFYIRIVAQDRDWDIFVNGEFLTKFPYRLPIRDLRHIFIDGDIELTRVAMEGKYYMVPFSYRLPQFSNGQQIYISGKPDHNADSFQINLRDNNDNIGMHISARFKEGAVVFNTKHHNHWGHEERPPTLPFHRGEDFDLIIVSTPEYYEVLVNGRRFHTYRLRESQRPGQELYIEGDIELQAVYV